MENLNLTVAKMIQSITTVNYKIINSPNMDRLERSIMRIMAIIFTRKTKNQMIIHHINPMKPPIVLAQTGERENHNMDHLNQLNIPVLLVNPQNYLNMEVPRHLLPRLKIFHPESHQLRSKQLLTRPRIIESPSN